MSPTTIAWPGNTELSESQFLLAIFRRSTERCLLILTQTPRLAGTRPAIVSLVRMLIVIRHARIGLVIEEGGAKGWLEEEP